MSNLFKDRTKEESYTTLLELLRSDETIARTKFLGVTDPEPSHSKPDRKACRPLTPEEKESDGKEKRVCKCLYYSKDIRNCERNKECDYLKRGLRRRVHPDSEYTVEDYEIPPYDKIKDVGNVDLILKGKDGTLYATEVKPPEGNPETLLRMIAEIVTYTLCGFQYKGVTTRRAIAFFAGSEQDQEYDRERNNEELQALLTEAEIAVFRLEETKEEKVYKICKIYAPKS